MQTWVRPNVPSRLAYELAVHTILQRIKDKVEFRTNYANVFTQIRYLTHQLDFYDRHNNPGFISIEDLKIFLTTRMNFISLDTELEYLFYHFDEDMTGFIDYKDFVNQLYESAPIYLPILTSAAVNTLEKIRMSFISPHRNEHNFLRFLLTLKERARPDREGFSSRSNIIETLFGQIATGGKSSVEVVSKKELSVTVKFFDFRRNDTVHVPTLVRYLKSIISTYRRQLIRTVYNMLGDRDGRGYPTVGDIKACYHIQPYRTIKLRGKSFGRATLDELLGYFFGQDSLRVTNDRAVPWETFYEYYQCISLGIDSEELFELVIRHSWQIPNGMLGGRPMANDAEDVFELSRSESFDTITTRDEKALLPSASRSFDLGSRSFDIGSQSSDRTLVPSSIDFGLPTSRSVFPSIDLGLAPSRSFDGSVKISKSFDLLSPKSTKPLPSPSVARNAPITKLRTPRKTVTRPIVIVHSDFTEQTIYINDELGKTKLDPESLCRELNAMGIFDIKYLKI